MPWIFNLLFFKKIEATFKEAPQYRSFILSVFIVSIVIFSFFGQKSLWYVLPILPFGLIFFTRFFVENKDQPAVIRLNRIVLSIMFGFFGVLSLSLLLSPMVQSHVFKNFGGNFSLSPFVMIGLATMSFLTLAYIYFSKRDLIRLLSVSSVMLVLVYSLSNLYFFPFEQKFTQINQVGAYLHEQEVNKKGIVLYKSEYLGQFDYVGRLTAVIPVLKTSVALNNWLEQNPKGMVIYSGNHCPNAKMHIITSYNERARLVPFLLCKIV